MKAPAEWEHLIEVETSWSDFWTRLQNTEDYMDFYGFFHRSGEDLAKEVKVQLSFVKKGDGSLDHVYLVFFEEQFVKGTNQLVGGEFQLNISFDEARRIIKEWK